MREITPDAFKVYKLDELDERARGRAIETVAGKLGGDWWDLDNIDDVSDTIRYAFAQAIGTPGLDKWGEADFPGIHGITLEGWDLDRGNYLALRGWLTPENAPELPWADGLVEVLLSGGRGDYTEIEIEVDEDDVDLMNLLDLPENRRDCAQNIEAQMDRAVMDAMHKALEAGRKQMEWVSSEENAIETIEANEYEFLEDGTLYL